MSAASSVVSPSPCGGRPRRPGRSSFEARVLRTLAPEDDGDWPASALHYRHMGADRHAVVEIDDVLIEQADAAARDGLADSLRLGGAVQTEQRVMVVAVKIERARPKRIVGAALQPARVRLIARHRRDHVGGWR